MVCLLVAWHLVLIFGLLLWTLELVLQPKFMNCHPSSYTRYISVVYDSTIYFVFMLDSLFNKLMIFCCKCSGVDHGTMGEELLH